MIKNNYFIAGSAWIKTCFISVLVVVLTNCSTHHQKQVVDQIPMPALSNRCIDMKNLISQQVQVLYEGDTVHLFIFSHDLFFPNSDHMIPTAYPLMEHVVHFIQTFDNIAVKVVAYRNNLDAEKIKKTVAKRQAERILAWLSKKTTRIPVLYALGASSQDLSSTLPHCQRRYANCIIKISVQRDSVSSFLGDAGAHDAC